MSVDGGVIDEDHKILISYINDFLSMSDLYNNCSEDFRSCDKSSHLPCGQELSCDKKNSKILASLKFYTTSHFKREEKLQKEIGFPIQANAHENLIKELNNMIKTLETSDASSEDFLDTLNGMGNFFNGWLIDHIIKEDLKMRPYFNIKHAKSTRYLALD